MKAKKDLIYEAKRALFKNWFIVALLFLGIFYWMVHSINAQTKAIAEMKETQERTERSVFAVTDSGVVVEVERHELFADAEESVVARALRSLVVARAEITNGFRKSKFETPIDILKSTEQLQDFLEYVTVDKKKAEKVIVRVKDKEGITVPRTALELSQQGTGFFTGYLEKLKQSIQSNTLPHIVSIYKTEIKEYQPDGNRFKIMVNYYVTMQNWIGYDAKGENIYETTKSRYEIEALGYLNIKLRTLKDKDHKGINKLGMHFYQLQIKLPIAKIGNK